MLSNVPPAGRGFFTGIVPREVEFTAEGRRRRIELPQRYFDWTLMLAHFPASATAIKKLLPEGSGLEPVSLGAGLGVVSIGAFEYKRPATLDPYNEVGVMFPVRLRPALPLPAVPLFRPEWFSDLGFWVWQLPVTTQESCDAGRTLWSFPKRVGKITFHDHPDQRRRRCVWIQEGAHVLTLDLRTSNTSRQLREFLAYSVLGGRLQQTLVQTYGDYDESRFGFDASFALGDHPIADRMRELGMIDVAIGRLYSDKAEGILPGPSPVPFSNVPAPLQAPRVLKSIVERAGRRRSGTTVAILGGGVAGLSAAHELAERGFDVTVYEPRPVPGGKARSMSVPQPEGLPGESLPCEHGFRFFPGFYKHLPDTMSRIPYAPTGKTVADNLVATSRMAIDFAGDEQLVFPTRFPTTLADLGTLIVGAGLVQERTGCTAQEITDYINKIWQLLTSCEERRLEKYEDTGWWEYLEADDPKYSDAYRNYLASTTRTLVAADPRLASTRTVGNVLLQMLFDLATPGVSIDRVLNGPTNDVWIDPWIAHLKTLGVKWQTARMTRLLVEAGKIAGVEVGDQIKEKGETIIVNRRTIRAEYYVVAIPVERMDEVLQDSPEVVAADRALAGIAELRTHVESMTGIQFYFRETLPLEAGHYMHLDSPWALTSLAQAQFWSTDLRRYADGSIRDILSVDISDWNKPGLAGGPAGGKTANDCSRKEIKEEVWAQLQHSLPFLQDLEPAAVYLDEAIEETEEYDWGKRRLKVKNVEPLLVNRPKSWQLRPEARTAIPNLFLAADYVRTYTDLATMEGANEAARRAVNGILEATHSVETPCAVWNLHEPPVLAPWRWLDRFRYFRGMDWSSDFPLALRGLQIGLSVVNAAVSTVTGGVAATVGAGVTGGIASETAGQDDAVPAAVQEEIGDRLDDLIDGMKSGVRADLEPLFLPNATITIGLRQGSVRDVLPRVRKGIVATIEDFKSIYRLGPRVHLRMRVTLCDQGRIGGGEVEGHVHLVFVRSDEGRWLISSLRYRREGLPVHRETLGDE